MSDIKTPEERSRNMAKVKGKNTLPEIFVRKTLFSLGFRFRLNRKDLPGKPDIVLPKYKTVIFVHGCFWHQHEGCKKAHLPSSNKEFWEDKLTKNKNRDLQNLADLLKMGWKVLWLWECTFKNSKEKAELGTVLNNWIKSPSQFGESETDPEGNLKIGNALPKNLPS